ncbi:uncharacterized protein [Diadema setosum]|uniref:uncharacterized protein n=1 Tax=Diadema setosum TaxID=31175 RepID=UPI003B3A886F
MVQSCDKCQYHQPSQASEPLMQPDIPSRPWEVVATDLFEINGNQWLIIVDYYSKYPFVRKLPDPATSSAVIATMKQIFAEHGIPRTVISDNGPHYSSLQLREFAAAWNFNHSTSSPRRPQGNGFVERQIRTIKNIMKKATNLPLALLHWRMTPVDNSLPSPAEILMGRKLKCDLPIRITNSNPNADTIHQRLQQRQETQKQQFDQHARPAELPPLYTGQQVRIQHPTTKCWQPATVYSKAAEPRSYVVQSPNGKLYRRNRQHIRADHTGQADKQITPTSPHICDEASTGSPSNKAPSSPTKHPPVSWTAGNPVLLTPTPELGHLAHLMLSSRNHPLAVPSASQLRLPSRFRDYEM